MSNKELVAGDTVWSETSHYTTNQSKRQVRQATITKVGRLYYEVKVGGSKPLKFEKGNLRAKDSAYLAISGCLQSGCAA